ncbi:hypothetical protein BCR35DRAFT_332519 [Leucosporidium creatinivorum]|uniref:Uncharacterized protein n=1 Tax=Leucosporidium creatinivorum TaxID=106004 RepID=A0A1Y2F132_9BASI|nr:hypothetical protein BCR35DRAFT_332519 [Leucosporidium creatinivorum]
MATEADLSRCCLNSHATEKLDRPQYKIWCVALDHTNPFGFCPFPRLSLMPLRLLPQAPSAGRRRKIKESWRAGDPSLRHFRLRDVTAQPIPYVAQHTSLKENEWEERAYMGTFSNPVDPFEENEVRLKELKQELGGS